MTFCNITVINDMFRTLFAVVPPRIPTLPTFSAPEPSDQPPSANGTKVAVVPRRPLLVVALILGLALALATTALLTRPAPAAAASASEVIVRAHGIAGTEQLALRINDEEAARWTMSTVPADYVFTAEAPIEVESVEVAFLNDDGVHRDLHVDYVDVGGIVLQSESPTTISTGTYLRGEGCRERGSVSAVLHCRGSFRYDVPVRSPGADGDTTTSAAATAVDGDAAIDNPIVIAPEPTPVPAASLVRVRVLGTTGSERIELRINTETVVATEIDHGWQMIEHEMANEVVITDAELHFVNDNGPRDVRVDYLEVDGERFESEDPATRAVGLWASGRCRAGASTSEWLRCRGSFRYDVNNTAAVLSPPATTTTVPATTPTTTPPTSTSTTSTTAPPETSAPATVPPARAVGTPTGSGGQRYSIAQVIDGTIGAGDGSNPNEESPMGRHDAPLALNQGWNWAQGPTRNSVWGQLGSGNSRYAEFRCAVIPELGHTPPVPFRINVREAAYYQFVNNDWQKGFDVDLTGGNHGGYLGTAGGSNANPFTSGSHGLIEWRREADGSFSAPWNPSALMMHFWASQRKAPAPGQTAEFLTSEVRLQQPDGQTVDLSRVRVLFQCGVDYYSTTGGQGTQVPGPGIAKYHRATESWKPGLWITLPRNTAASSVSDFAAWLSSNPPPNVG